MAEGPACRARFHANLNAECHLWLRLANAALCPAFGTHPLRSTESEPWGFGAGPRKLDFEPENSMQQLRASDGRNLI